MYLFKYKDGTVKEAYQGFDQKAPEWSMMEGVEEVMPVKQVLIPQMKLVPKVTAPQPEVKTKTTKGKKKNA